MTKDQVDWFVIDQSMIKLPPIGSGRVFIKMIKASDERDSILR